MAKLQPFIRKSQRLYLFFSILTTAGKKRILTVEILNAKRTMDLIIDGYNLIGSDRGLGGVLEHKRNWLVQQLSRYQKIKQFNVILAFDGWRSGSPNQVIEKKDGVTVIYSRLGEKADAVIVRVAREKGSGCVVVTSDREIRTAVERSGAVAVSAGEFNQILRSLDGGYADDDLDAIELPQSRTGRRLAKSERRKNEKLQKLRL
jgi:predicted RNA-binding protein with PIN domain